MATHSSILGDRHFRSKLVSTHCIVLNIIHVLLEMLYLRVHPVLHNFVNIKPINRLFKGVKKDYFNPHRREYISAFGFSHLINMPLNIDHSTLCQLCQNILIFIPKIYSRTRLNDLYVRSETEKNITTPKS